MKIGEEKINAISEKDVDRTSAEGKASSVQFIHFIFTDNQLKKFNEANTQITIGIDHDLYNHAVKISENTKKSLIQDFI